MLLWHRQLLERLGAPQVVIPWRRAEEEIRVPELIGRHLQHLLVVRQVVAHHRASRAIARLLRPLLLLLFAPGLLQLVRGP
jgi:hypothetical protein